ncbi:hypothetical protein DM02DRAFT_681053 [Periconia macrospinosa]|uniref:Uncharacterized protein n=1 Tax=Periconia macrospinosa TaxID=97972 RepID=A0A2V1DLF2_9PLEO|nr:hypothetical protein DM02DRAFT_681053 [Periconia macrospinosa]
MDIVQHLHATQINRELLSTDKRHYGFILALSPPNRTVRDHPCDVPGTGASVTVVISCKGEVGTQLLIGTTEPGGEVGRELPTGDMIELGNSEDTMLPAGGTIELGKNEGTVLPGGSTVELGGGKGV